MSDDNQRKEDEQAFLDTHGVSWSEYVTEAYSTPSNIPEQKAEEYAKSLSHRLAQLAFQQSQQRTSQKWNDSAGHGVSCHTAFWIGLSNVSWLYEVRFARIDHRLVASSLPYLGPRFLGPG
jgi:hypothetical protein